MSHPNHIHVQHTGNGDRLIRLQTGEGGEVWFRASDVLKVHGGLYPATEGMIPSVDVSLARDEHILLTGEHVPPGGAGQLAHIFWGEFGIDISMEPADD